MKNKIIHISLLREAYKCIILVILIVGLIVTPMRVYAYECDKKCDDEIIINGISYNMEEFGDRVVECTISEITQMEFETEEFGIIKYEYDNNYRISKVVGDNCYQYKYNQDGLLIETLLNDKQLAAYEYENGKPVSCFIGEKKYWFVIDNEIINGLCDINGRMLVTYDYSDFGDVKKIEGDLELSKMNSILYNGWIYDFESEDYYIPGGGYYNPEDGTIYGINTYLDVNELYGDLYDEISERYNSSDISMVSSNDIYQLTYAASQYYENGLHYYTQAYSGNAWYTNLSGGKSPYLMARIIYAENTYVNGNTNMNNWLKYNRQGVAWTIINRFYEASYRYNRGDYSLKFSNSGSQPTYYSVITYNSQYSSLSSVNAKGAQNTANVAYQQAFWAASCAKVCNNFEQIDAVYPQPTGISSQCYMAGMLSTNSVPSSSWCRVAFPGDSHNYSNSTNYSAFPYYNNIGYFNVFFSYSSETMYIESAYYGQ